MNAGMYLRPIAKRVSWPLLLTVVAALVLLRHWYASAGYLAYGDLAVARAAAIVPDAFHLWSFSDELGHSNAISWWHAAMLGSLFVFHIGDQYADRLVLFWLVPPLFIGGLFVLAKSLTKDNTAAGVAALAGFFNVDFLVRVLGGHGTALMAIALAPWILFGSLQLMRTRRAGWAGFVILASALATAYDARWVLPVFPIVIALAVFCPRENCPKPALRLGVVAAFAAGLALANLPWLAASIAGGWGYSPAPPQSYGNPVWVQRLSLASFWDGLAIWNPLYANSFDDSAVAVGHAPVAAAFLIVSVFAGAMLARRRTLAVLFFVLYIFGAFLYKGAQPPFGSIYLWAFQHVPLFNLYREPLKFGAAASLCASIVLAYGIAELRKYAFAKPAGALAVCAVVLFLAAPAFAKPGMTVTRFPSPSFAAINAVIASDPHFSRVLWLPQRSRWVSGTRLHPVADGALLGGSLWSRFRTQRGLDDDVLNYVRGPLFAQLLKWNAFRYVVIDCSTETQTFRTDSFSCGELGAELSAHTWLRPVSADGPLRLFRIRGPIAPALWSANSAVLVRGAPPSLNAGAWVGALDPMRPFVLAQDVRGSVSFTERYVFDDADRTGVVGGNAQRIVGADSVDWGPAAGDAIIDRQPTGQGLPLRRIADGPSTLAYTGTLAESALQGFTALKPLPDSTRLARPDNVEQTPRTRANRGAEITGFSIPVYDKPMLRVRSLGKPEKTQVFELMLRLRDNAGRSYLLAAPPFLGASVPTTELDVRDWLFRTVVADAHADALLGSNDGFDMLHLVTARLIQIRGPRATQQFSIVVRASNPVSGYPVRSVTPARAAAFTCQCAKHATPGREQFSFGRFGGRRAAWMKGVVAIHGRAASYSGIIVSQSRAVISGISTVAGQPFSIERKDVLRIEPAPDAALIDMHLGAPAYGVLVFRGSGDPRVTLQLFLRASSGKKSTWIAQDVPFDSTRRESFTVRADLLAEVHRAGYDRIGATMLLLRRRNVRDSAAVSVELSDAAVVTDRIGNAPKAALRASGGTASSSLAATSTPLAAWFGRINAPHGSSGAWKIVPSPDVSFRADSGARWLVFSEAFDPAWRLVDASGNPAGGSHVAAFGALNAWYVPRGLHGNYNIVYAVDGAARFGGAIALFIAVGCLLIVMTLAFPERSGRY